AGDGLRERVGRVVAADGSAHGSGGGGAGSPEARRALPGVPEARGGGGADRVGTRAAVRDRVQQAVQGRDREPSRPLRVLRPGPSRQVEPRRARHEGGGGTDELRAPPAVAGGARDRGDPRPELSPAPS